MAGGIVAVGSTFAVLAALIFPPAAPQRAAATPSPPATIRVVTMNGSGCTPETADARSISDGTAVQLRFHAFTARAGSGTSPVEGRRNCQFALQVDGPAGWRFALAGIEATGSADLRRRARMFHRTTAYFAGSPTDMQVSRSRQGPIRGSWESSETFVPAVFSRCGESRYLNVNTELRVQSARTGRASSLELNEVIVRRLLWQRC